jgi:hypothetical protein
VLEVSDSSQIVLAPADATFVDIPVTHPLFGRIEWLVAHKITSGYVGADGAAEYRPANSILRSEMATFLYRLAGSPAFTPPVSSPFVDVPTTAGYYKAMAWLVSEKITTGYAGKNANEYRPSNSVTRSEMATFLYRVAGSPAFTPPVSSPFVDVPTTAGYYKAMAWLVSEGITAGYIGTAGAEYRSANNVLRSEMATFLWNTAVEYESASADGESHNIVSSKITLRFNKTTGLSGLSIADITLSNPDVTKESLTKINDSTYDLAITGSWVNNTSVNVAIATKHNVTPATQSVILYAPLNFYSAVANGVSNTEVSSEVTLTFDSSVTGLSADDISFSGSGAEIIKGELNSESAGDGVYVLAITGSWVDNTSVDVTVTKEGYVFTPATQTINLYSNNIFVNCQSLTANGALDSMTTNLISLTFDKDIADLDVADITLSNPNIQKGTLTKSSSVVNSYELTVNGTWENGTAINVTVTKPGYTIACESPVTLYTNNKIIVLSVTTTAASQSVKINDYFNGFTVNWGDGNTTNAGTHTYATPNTYLITLTTQSSSTPYWTFATYNYDPLVPSTGTTSGLDIKITAMPPLQAFLGVPDSTGKYTIGDGFFAYFNTQGALTGLPAGSFDTSNIISVGNNFFYNFNGSGKLASLPAGSFDTSNITATGTYFFGYFNYYGVLVSLPAGSFDTSNIISVGNYFFCYFNQNGKLVSLPAGSFAFSDSLNSVGNGFFIGFNQSGELTSLPDGSFNTSEITTKGTNYLSNFNASGGKLPTGQVPF